MWKKALALFDEMEEKGIEPTEVTYSVTISALGNGLQWQRALRLLHLVSSKFFHGQMDFHGDLF
jgi:hypothetical protein